jgi:hypothetical protein
VAGTGRRRSEREEKGSNSRPPTNAAVQLPGRSRIAYRVVSVKLNGSKAEIIARLLALSPRVG